MDFSLPEEVQMIQKNVREFTERELFPLEQEFCLQGRLPLPTRLELERKGRDLGFWALDVPAEYSGAGLGQLAMCVIHEELYRSPLLFEFGGYVEPALYLCNDKQKEKYFHPIIRGEKKSCYAFTEAGTGSDLARVQTRAVKKGDRWIINGSKTFISHVERADFIMLFASTDPGKGSKGLTCFLVDKNAPGLHISNLATRQAIQWMLADSEVELMAARLLVFQAAWMADSNQKIRNEAFVAKLYATEMAQRVTDRALQIYGGMGYTREVPIQSFYRQVRVWRIGHGTSEIHRMMIARNMLRD